MVQLVDLKDSDAVKNTHQNYYTWSQCEILREMKEDFLTVSDEVLQQKSGENARNASYELPDGTQVQMTAFERQSITEKLFQNPLAYMSKEEAEKHKELNGFPGVQQMIVESISKSDIDIRRDLFQNVILSGGNSMLKGF